MDRSRFRNPDAPPGYVKPENGPELKYKEGIVIDGYHYIYVPYLYDAHIDERDDYATLSDLIFSDEEFAKSLMVSEKKVAAAGKKRIRKAESKKSCDVGVEDSESDSSSSSSTDKHHNPRFRRRHQKKEQLPSPSPIPVLTSENYTWESQAVFGVFICDICNIKVNGISTYNAHVNGKKHLKNLKLSENNKMKDGDITANTDSYKKSLKYPIPSKDVIRKKVPTTACMQNRLENSEIPCLCLDFVIEIRSIDGIQYYCSLCDAICAASVIHGHVTGFKHQMLSVKHLKPCVYEHMKKKPNVTVKKEIVQVLGKIKDELGTGRMMVEIDEPVIAGEPMSIDSKPSTSMEFAGQPSTSMESRGQPSTSKNYGARPKTRRINFINTRQGEHSKNFCPEYF